MNTFAEKLRSDMIEYKKAARVTPEEIAFAVLDVKTRAQNAASKHQCSINFLLDVHICRPADKPPVYFERLLELENEFSTLGLTSKYYSNLTCDKTDCKKQHFGYEVGW